MSTPAWITRTLSDGSLEMRHCRSSGGPEGVGMGLAKFANTPALVDWLFGLNRSFDSILSAAWPGDNKASKETGEGGYIPWPAQSPAHQETPVPVLLAYGADDSCVEQFGDFTELWSTFENSGDDYLYMHRKGAWYWASGPLAQDAVPVETMVLMFGLEQARREGMPVDATKEARAHDLWSNHSPFDQKILELFLVKRLKESFGEEHDGGDALLTVAAWNKADLATAVDDNSPSRDIRSAPGFKM